MRQLVVQIGAVLLVCSLAGCDGGSSGPSELKSAPPPPEDAKALFKKPAKAPPAPGKGAFAHPRRGAWRA